VKGKITVDIGSDDGEDKRSASLAGSAWSGGLADATC
jgi:hypothetical protein